MKSKELSILDVYSISFRGVWWPSGREQDSGVEVLCSISTSAVKCPYKARHFKLPMVLVHIQEAELWPSMPEKLLMWHLAIAKPSLFPEQYTS